MPESQRGGSGSGREAKREALARAAYLADHPNAFRQVRGERSQAEVGLEFGLAASQWSALERGQARCPRPLAKLLALVTARPEEDFLDACERPGEVVMGSAAWIAEELQNMGIRMTAGLRRGIREAARELGTAG